MNFNEDLINAMKKSYELGGKESLERHINILRYVLDYEELKFMYLEARKILEGGE